MNCTNCHTTNPEAAKFCSNCGASLVARCANCQSELAVNARFCSNCGQPVGGQTAADTARLTRLAAATPAPLADKIRAAHLTGERKIVTCLFADVVGSTTLAEQMDPDDWTEIMNRAFDKMSPAIYRYEGTIARLMGDAILAFFGAPVAHEDDPVRAVHAALELLTHARTYAAEVRGQYGIEFAIRVGLNTGPVVVGNVGSDLKYEYTAMGDAVNLAARMQSSARTMTVLISEHTHRYIAPAFDCEDLGPIEVKGKAEPVRVYEVRAPKADPGRMRGLEAAGLESQMVGRESELAALAQTTSAVQSGIGCIAVIIGEAGLGKTRLIAEWKSVTPTPGPSPIGKFPNRGGESGVGEVHWAEGHCLSYGQTLPYHLLIDLLRALIEVSSSATEEQTLAALRASAVEHGAGEAVGEIYAYLGHLLVPQAKDPAIAPVRALDPQTLQAHYLSALRQLLLIFAAHHPLALICDDIHWADPSSVELLAKLLPLIHEQRILFCFITRPDRDAPGWKLVAAARDLGHALTEIALNPLSESDSRQLVSNLLNVDALPAATRATILKRAEGNPFFVEEVIRMLIDRGMIARQASGWVTVKDAEAVDIPDNLHGLLLARIDRLVDEAKRTLRVASVIGRQFSVRVLEQVAAIVIYLSPLEASGLIRLANAQPEVEYLFRHALVQEAAYSSLVKQDRRQLHLAVGEALERLYPERLESRELVPVLAQHFYQAGDDAHALKYVTLAGDAAARVYANAEAIAHYTRALEVVKRSRLDTADVSHLYTSLGNALELSARYGEAMAQYAELESIAQTRGNRRMELDAVMARAKVLATPNPAFDPTEGRRALERALTLSRETGDRTDECRILWNLMVLDVFSGGDMRRAITYGEQSIALARELGLRERQAFATQDIYYAYVALDQPALAWQRLIEARDLWRELGVTPMLADNLSNLAIRHYEHGELEQAIADADESYRLYQSIGNVYGLASSRFAVSGVYIERGEFDAAFAVIAEGLQHAEQGGHSVGRVSLLVDEARALAAIGETARAVETARRAVTAGETHFPLWMPMAHATLARLLIETGDVPGAAQAVAAGRAGLKPEALMLYGREMVGLAECDVALARGEAPVALAASEALIAQIHRAETLIFLPEALWLKGRAQMMLNAPEAARATLTEAEAVAQRIGARRLLRQILISLSQTEERLNYRVSTISEGDTMSNETNKALIRRYREIYNSNQLDQLSEVLAPDFTPHNLMPGVPPTLEAIKQTHQGTVAIFPDVQVTTDDLLAEGDKVVERWTQTMTHTGAPFFIGNLPASGKSVRFTGCTIYRIHDGKIAEHWAEMNFTSVLRQLGLMPGS